MVIERLYTDTCSILMKKEEYTDPDTKITKHHPEILYEGVPCRLSYQNAYTEDTNTFNDASQNIKLFLDPDLYIPAGSTITVERQGRTMEFNASSRPAVYPSHQEITLEIKESRA